MRIRLFTLAALLGVVVMTASAPLGADSAASGQAGPAFSSIGPLAFGGDGVLFAADRQAAKILALEMGGQKPGAPGTLDVPGLDGKIAALFGTDAKEISITDLAVEPRSRNSYLSVMRGQGEAAQPALVRVDGAGAIEIVSLDHVKFTSVAMPNPVSATPGPRNNRMSSITDMALIDGRLYVTGLSNEEFSSKFWAVPYPFKTADNGTSVEIWHGSHGRFETGAPVLTFVPTTVNGVPTLLAAYTCTPLVKFPISALQPGAKVMGTTISELGSHNQPIDMVLYKKDGREFLLIANTAHGVLKVPTADVPTAAAIKDPVPDTQTAGIKAEKIASLTGVLQLDLLDATHTVLLARNDTGLSLRSVPLP